ncbi:MAG: AAA family ATPase, partial [Pseudomonadota bacterium]|nr:AAA family ATPase [Pseudomonadota bacterium]
VSAAEAEVAAAAKSEASARARWRELQHQGDKTRERHSDAERAANQQAARRSALTEAKTRISANRREADAAKKEAARALAALPSPTELEAKLNKVRGEITVHRAQVAEARAEAQALAREAEIARKRLEAIAAEQHSWADTSKRTTTQIAALDVRLTEARRERTTLADAPRSFEEMRRSMIGEVSAAEAQRRQAADRLAEGEALLADADRASRAALDALSTAREQAGRAEERSEGAKRRLGDIAREIRDMLEVDPAGVVALAGIEDGKPLPEVTQIEAQLEKLRRDRERLGAVNLRAEEEFREVEGQHKALTTERDDLVEAIKRLRQGIQNLNREARERLLASFEVVNGHFKKLFSELFGGGQAELQLIESDDPLEAGLEIMAKPPGKKLQSLSLLSGGEQALTALALIFAVFLTNPAPICVLDEVDAPLDDHNVERFCDLLDEMTRATDTRFVIITHNPITMARMNRLYGVTMAERGISQLVSVDLESAVKIKDAAGAA